MQHFAPLQQSGIVHVRNADPLIGLADAAKSDARRPELP
jgi:hypothetical protein